MKKGMHLIYIYKKRILNDIMSRKHRGKGISQLPDMSGLCIFLDLNIKAFLSAFHDPALNQQARREGE